MRNSLGRRGNVDPPTAAPSACVHALDLAGAAGLQIVECGPECRGACDRGGHEKGARGGGGAGWGRGALAAAKDAPEPRVHGRGAAGCVYMPPQR